MDTLCLKAVALYALSLLTVVGCGSATDVLPYDAYPCGETCEEGRAQFMEHFSVDTPMSRNIGIWLIPQETLNEMAEGKLSSKEAVPLGVCLTIITPNSSIVLISESTLNNSELLNHVIVHELGHCILDLEHSDDPNDIMYPSVPSELID